MRFPRTSGVLLHPTSLPGPHGSGDFGPAAYHFIDWLVSAGQKLWQILPLGSIGPGNSPYMSTSAFAGNPLFIDLQDLANRGWLDQTELAQIYFPADRIDYATVIPFRMMHLRCASESFFSSGGDDHEAFRAFCEEQKAWLGDYALFMALAQRDPSKEWSDWEPDLAHRKPTALESAKRQYGKEIRFWEFVQWNFFRQWRDVKQYANERDIKIIGDIPIFIAYHSADVWTHQHLFYLDQNLRPNVVAGVPPDFFSETGQLWGNPLYRWEHHQKENYAWWIERLRAVTQLTDIVRIDHFRGFAGYWEIPAKETTAINGRWRPGPGSRFFTAVKSALGQLPIIAEDLGVITPDVIELRDRFELPGMRILQFAFAGDTANSFLPHNYVHNTVVYTGTHDNDTSRSWLQSATERERMFAQMYLKTDGREIHWDFIHAASESVADMALYPLQDILGLGNEARMNLPGKSEGYWEWRFQWRQVEDWHANRLRNMSAVHGRNDIKPLPLPDYPTGRALP
ncbi:MAG: 4-alpha-glucanotransferase [Pseudomonadota bacterium]